MDSILLLDFAVTDGITVMYEIDSNIKKMAVSLQAMVWRYF